MVTPQRERLKGGRSNRVCKTQCDEARQHIATLFYTSRGKKVIKYREPRVKFNILFFPNNDICNR